jgi:anti-anti-sigma factor
VPAPMLSVSVRRTGDTAVVKLEGELDVASAELLETRLAELLDGADSPRRIRVDAELLMFVDVAGLKPLLHARRRLGEGSIAIRHAGRPVARVLKLLDLADELGLDT